MTSQKNRLNPIPSASVTSGSQGQYSCLKALVGSKESNPALIAIAGIAPVRDSTQGRLGMFISAAKAPTCDGPLRQLE